ncbi:MAG TPA: hypothetical protein VLV45_12155 [Gemmatimonadales bacterium]|nr:hypothetical protein [Gemmatimonadales bacterium]
MTTADEKPTPPKPESPSTQFYSWQVNAPGWTSELASTLTILQQSSATSVLKASLALADAATFLEVVTLELDNVPGLKKSTGG